ncbi:MAG: DUF1573 domain-containing protein [Flavobacteriales bacterium]
MYKLFFLSVALVFFACDDMAKNVNEKQSVSIQDKVEQKSLSTNLVMNSNSANGISKVLGPQFSFEKDVHDFGQLIDGEKVAYSFKFTNSGDAPLIISSAKGSCGCTVPNWPKDPIAPGESGTIDVSFNSSGRTGKQNKAVTLTANTNPSRKVINITSEVITE